jgi:pimeloyl-ACP methyl ester carboxylesterase
MPDYTPATLKYLPHKTLRLLSPMKRLLVIVLLACAPAVGPAQAAQSSRSGVRYGSNPAAGATFTHEGVRLYYEVYGTGEPLLIVHGNGGSIADVAAQIAHFRTRYRVIAMDSRDQGKSGDSRGAITYEEMTDDLSALLLHLKSGPVNVLGWSDGGIEALLLGVRHPEQVKKIVSMAANLNPGPDAISPEVVALAHSMLDAVPPVERETPQGRREVKVTQMLLDEPHIEPAALEAISAPTLVLATDHDLIRDEHTLEIYHHVPNAQLCIFPNATHMIPYDDPMRFNAVVERFLRAPFVKKDRIKDTFASLEKMRAGQEKR